MVPEDLLFWIAPFADAPSDDSGVLCKRHADAMVVPRGWTLDDRRESALRLFKPRPADPEASSARRAARRSRPADRRSEGSEQPEQLQIDGTGEIPRPVEPDPAGEHAAAWEPEFDHDDDLGGLLEVKSPLLARAFRGTDRPR